MQIRLLGKTISMAFDGESWLGRIMDSRLPTGTISVEVYAFLTEEENVPNHLELLSQAIEVIANVQPLINERLYEFFLVHRELNDEEGNIWGHDFTNIKSASDCWASLIDPTLLLEIQGGEVYRVSLLADCDWNLDGGIEVRFEGTNIVYCGGPS